MKKYSVKLEILDENGKSANISSIVSSEAIEYIEKHGISALDQQLIILLNELENIKS